VSEKCTAYVFGVNGPSSGGCRSNWEEWMCYWDCKGGGISGKWKIWKGVDSKKLVLAQREFRLPRRDQWIREDWLWEEKRNAIFRSVGPVHPTQHHTSEDYSLKQHCCQNSNLIFDSTNKEINQVYFTLWNVFLHVEMYLYLPSEDTILLPIWHL